METLDYRNMLLISLWQYNHHEREGLTPQLFRETFGEIGGNHYYDKWIHYFNHNLWDMIAYLGNETENGQKFCDMLVRQVRLYRQNRKPYGIQ
ncbi:hypothetical protein [Bacteroides reticulotermitis]|uniref:Uncharacterized protein n=1 Tax=Bacteroides reticulotermitis TaxID=1133319 RepID=A0A840D2A1_9BACE|nr:hypothetical protein [Bacteroides reticulotermitis]MBB4045746.1 hypothetical protein [Bacteroides reticulotermitis]